MKKYKKILITGGSGLLGKGMGETAPMDLRIISVHMRDYVVDDSCMKHLIVDIRDKQQVDRLFKKFQFDAVVHAAGIANVDYAESHYAESLESNIVGTLNITSACRRTGSYLIYISSNAVFDGTAPPYDESCKVNPINKYGIIKTECERLITETLQDFVIVRPIIMYGWNHRIGRPNPATWIIEKLKSGESIRMVTDVYENPLYNLQCGKALWEIVKRKPLGIIHLGGAGVLNRYEFALRLANVFALDAALIQPVESTFFPTIAPRPKNTSFSTKRMETELEIMPIHVEEGLQEMKNRISS